MRTRGVTAFVVAPPLTPKLIAAATKSRRVNTPEARARHMRYTSNPGWLQNKQAVRLDLTHEQVSAAAKRSPTFKHPRVQDGFARMLRPGGWTYIRRPNGETWLVVRRGWHDECFEIPKAIAERFEALSELVASW